MRKHAKTSPKYDLVYKFIVEFKRTHDGNSPTIREIGTACDVSSTAAVRYYLNGLVKCGLIKRSHESGEPRMISVVGGMWNAPAVKPN